MIKQKVNSIFLNIERYRNVVGDEFLEQKVRNFPIKEVFRDEISPDRRGEHFPVCGSVREFFGTPYVEEKLRDGLLFYKRAFGFLKQPEVWSVVKADSSTNPPSVLYSCNGRMFSERTYPEDLFIGDAAYKSAGEHFQKLCNLSKREFSNSRFEDVIGIFINKRSDLMPNRIYSSHSGGIGLDEIALETLSPIRVEIEKTLAGALKGLAKDKILYFDPIPTNIRYDIGSNKFVFYPHSNICFGFTTFGVKDISMVLYTHDWIEDVDGFCKYFLGPDLTDKSLERLCKSVKNDTETLEMGGIEEIYQCWQKRNKTPLPKG